MKVIWKTNENGTLLTGGYSLKELFLQKLDKLYNDVPGSDNHEVEQPNQPSTTNRRS